MFIKGNYFGNEGFSQAGVRVSGAPLEIFFLFPDGLENVPQTLNFSLKFL